MSSLKRKADLAAATAAANDPKKAKKDSSLTSFFGAPKTVVSSTNGSSSSSQGAAAGFSKDKWVAGLKPETAKLLKLEIDTLDPTWLAHLKDEITSDSFLSLKKFLQKEIDGGATIYPPPEDIYSWSRHTPLNTVKAVIVGQDPYIRPNQAHGLCFSVRPPTPAPPSLKNIYTAIKRDYPSFNPPPKNLGLLTPWAEQGVLMLNTCLTVRAGDSNSHANRGWEQFTQKVLDTVVSVRKNGVVFLAWGSPAQKRCTKIGGKHLVLKSVHPSPLSASRGFFECGHFKKTNEWLETRYGKDGVINWDLNVQKPIKAPATGGPVKVTAQRKEPAQNGQPSKSDGKVLSDGDFDGEDDEDAIEALEELAKSDAVEPPENEDGATKKKDVDSD